VASIDLINGEALRNAVALDHLPRVATAGDASQHVLAWDVDRVRSMSAADWLATRGPLPPDPTPQQTTDAIAAIEAARVAARAAAAAKRQQILTIAQTAVGVRIDLLTAVQIRALFAVILWKEDAIDAGLLVRPLSEWVT
jgi:hypothetical protein